MVTDHKDEEGWNSEMQGRWGGSAVGQELEQEGIPMKIGVPK